MWNLRLLPLLAVAAVCLVALKSMALLLGGGGGLTGSQVASAQSTAAPAAQAAPDSGKDKQAAAKPGKPEKPGREDEPPDGTVVANMPESIPKTEAELLQSLADRRRVLDNQARELEMRENLLKAAEQRVEARINELKSIEARIEGTLKQQDEERDEQFARLVRMYSSMKPKVAAEVFNRLDLDVLMGIVSRMKPRVMGPILAAMDPVIAQRLTMEIANKGQAAAEQNAPALPKITGQGAS
ncbi:MAG: MotE family protein [Hyphomicrobiales bacterium]